MNERLLIEIVERADENCELAMVPADTLIKFAELIVKECVDIISPYTVRMNKPGESYLHPIQEIKQHFGVK